MDKKFTATDKQYIGEFPIRQDIELLPADDPKDMKLGWVIEEVCGAEVYKDAAQSTLLINYGDIQVGDEVYVCFMDGAYRKAVVNAAGLAETEYNIYILEFDKDSRHCWSCSSIMNKKALETVSRMTFDDDTRKI